MPPLRTAKLLWTSHGDSRRASRRVPASAPIAASVNGSATCHCMSCWVAAATAPAADTAGASIDVLASSEPTNYDLALVIGGASPITVECQFNAAVYARVFVERAMQHFAALVTAALAAAGSLAWFARIP